MDYEKKDIFQLAKRLSNPRRAYLLVNPLQGKHMPVRPSVALEMMKCLGNKLGHRFPDAKLVIGFAETATAIGAAVADCFDDDCVYIHTTREEIRADAKWIFFQEEHSHATDQKLQADSLREWIAATPQVILVDDELSTGNTILNMIAQMRRLIPEMANKPVVAASVINRLSSKNAARLLEAGIECEFLLHIPNEDYSMTVMGFQTGDPVDYREIRAVPDSVHILPIELGDVDPRSGVTVGQYRKVCESVLDMALVRIQTYLKVEKRVLVLGTEEFMYLPLQLARRIEENVQSVSFHATTRSPIGVGQMPGYPIFNGYQITSFYEEKRNTYLYDLMGYDLAVVMTDSAEYPPAAVYNLASVLRKNGCRDIIFLGGGNHVQLLSS